MGKQESDKNEAVSAVNAIVMQNDFVKEPLVYFKKLKRLRERNKYAKDWNLQLKRKTNRHTTTNGYLWGWYEIFPLDIEVGFWNNETGRDDLKDVDITEWNNEAKRLSA